MNYILLILGFVLLIKGADFFVSGSSKVAKHFKIPPIIIGLTIVAFGTSSPEAAVSISAALQGSSDISIGNIVGSNIINTSLVIGIIALIAPLKVKKSTIIKEIPFTLLGGIVLIILLSDRLLQNLDINVLSRADGLILLAFFSIFLYYIVEVALKSNEIDQHLIKQRGPESNPPTIRLKKAILFILIGFASIVIGGWLVVESAQIIAIQLGMSEILVGLTVVAIGTSLPEIVTSIVAASKKESEIAFGNIIGSNIFNIFFVLGVSTTISPINIENVIFFDLFLMIAITFILLIFSTTHRKISRSEGFLLVTIYVAYLIYIVLRN